MHLCNTKVHIVFIDAQHNIMSTCTVTYVYIRRPIFAADDDFRKKKMVEPGVFNERKRVKFNLCNVSETNDADLNCFFICLRCSDAPTMRGF